MKPTLIVASVVATILAVAGVAGYVVVGHGTLPFPSAPSGAVGVGTLNVYVTDAPPADVNWSHVYVTFTVLQAHRANASDESGWHNITVVQSTVDLLSVRTVSALLGSSSLPAGMYTQLRIVVDKAWGVTTAGAKFNFTVPSGDLRTTHPFNVTTGQTASVTLDIDLSRSIQRTAMGYLFTPVIGSFRTS
jgi:hypothetical protein